MDSSVSFSSNWDLVEVLSCQRWGGGEPLFYLVQMPHQLSWREKETSYWSGGVNSAHRNLSPPSFKQLKSVMLETSFSTVLGPVLCWPAKVFCEVETGAFWCNQTDLTMTRQKIYWKLSRVAFVDLRHCNGSTYWKLSMLGLELQTNCILSTRY